MQKASIARLLTWMTSLSEFPYLLAAVIGYFLGSIPFGLLLTRIAGTADIRSIGSGNIGATNVLRTGRKDLAAATLLLDALKGVVAALIGALLSPPAATIAAAAAISRPSGCGSAGARASRPFWGGCSASIGRRD
jgi:glycerol-3-phosphate acyltransferase PlsY